MLKSFFFCVSLLLSFSIINAQNSINKTDSNGNKYGLWMKKYPNGNIRYSGQFDSGKEVGTFKFYSEFYSNHPQIIKNYKENSSACNVQFYTKTGVLESQGEMMGRYRTGTWLYYDTDGKTVLMEENYLHGKLSGEVKVFYKDGTLTELKNYTDNKLNGDSFRYTEKGKLIAKIPYIDDKIHGKVFYYHNTGVIRERGFYDHGKRVGRWEFYIDGVLVGYTEPNKKIVEEPVTLEEIENRKKK